MHHACSLLAMIVRGKGADRMMLVTWESEDETTCWETCEKTVIEDEINVLRSEGDSAGEWGFPGER